MTENEKIGGHVRHAGKANLNHETTVETEGHLATTEESAIDVDHRKLVDGHVVEHETYRTDETASETPPE